MSSRLAEYLRNENTSPLIWIEPADYATQAIAGGNNQWQAQAQTASSVLAQANSALQSHVLSLDVAPALFLDTEPPEPDNALAAVQDILSSQSAIQRAVEAAQAVEHTLAGQADLVLRLPSPAALLHRCGVPADGELDFDDLDDAAVALAGLVRQFSECKFAGLMLASDVGAEYAGDEFETFGAIVSTAKHYRWVSLLRVDGDIDRNTAAESQVDIILLPHVAPKEFTENWSVGDIRVGGGLSGAFWSGDDFSQLPAEALVYGDAPADISPEAVLERSAVLPRT